MFLCVISSFSSVCHIEELFSVLYLLCLRFLALRKMREIGIDFNKACKSAIVKCAPVQISMVFLQALWNLNSFQFQERLREKRNRIGLDECFFLWYLSASVTAYLRAFCNYPWCRTYKNPAFSCFGNRRKIFAVAKGHLTIPKSNINQNKAYVACSFTFCRSVFSRGCCLILLNVFQNMESIRWLIW